MGLRLIKEEPHAIPIDLDAPDPGLTKALEDIALDIHALGGGVKRDVRLWTLMGAAVSSALTLGGVALLVHQPAQAAPVPVVQMTPAPAPAPVRVEAAVPVAEPVKAVDVAEAPSPTPAPALDTDASIRRA